MLAAAGKNTGNYKFNIISFSTVSEVNGEKYIRKTYLTDIRIAGLLAI